MNRSHLSKLPVFPQSLAKPTHPQSFKNESEFASSQRCKNSKKYVFLPYPTSSVQDTAAPVLISLILALTFLKTNKSLMKEQILEMLFFPQFSQMNFLGTNISTSVLGVRMNKLSEDNQTHDNCEVD